jgi:hypothetical protein
MNPTAIYSKSGKGVQEAAGKTSLLQRGDRAVLAAIDGRATLAEVAQKVGKQFDAAFASLISQLDKNGFIREVSAGGAAATPSRPAGAAPASRPVPSKPVSKPTPAAESGLGDLDFSSLGASKPAPSRPAAPPAPPAMDQTTVLAKAREEAEAKAAAERERQKKEAEIKARLELEAKVRAEAEQKVKEEAEARAKAEAEAKVKAAREAAVRAAAEAKAKAEAEAKAKLEAERKAREEAERKAREAEELRLQAERKAKEEAERARKEAEEKARREAEELRQRLEEERKAREEAERKAKEEAERVRRELEEEKQRAEIERERAAAAVAAAKAKAEAARAAKAEATAGEAPPAKPAKKESFADSLLADLESFTAKEDDDGRAREEADRQAKAEAERRAREEAEERKREAAERQALEEAERQRRAEEEERRLLEEARRAREDEERRAHEEERRKREAEEIRRKAEAATAAAMAKEGRKAERAEDDIPVSDDDADMAEVEQEQAARAKAEAEERKREKREAKRRRKSEPPPPPPAPAKPRRPVKWGRPVATLLVVLLLGALGAAHVMPLDTADYERLGSEALGRPVKIGSANLWLFSGLPQVRFTDVRVGNAKISQVIASGWPPGLFGDKKEFENVRIEGLSLPQQGISDALFATVGAENISVSTISIHNLKLPGPATLPDNLTAEISLTPKGRLRTARLEGPDGLVARLTPREGGAIDVDVQAAGFTLPIAPQITLSKFAMKAVATPRGMTIPEWGGAIFQGGISGTATVRWSGSWTVDGVVTVRNINAAVFAPALLSAGSAEGTAKFSMSAADPAGLVSAGRLDGTFVVSKGTLGSFDLARYIQTGGKQATGTTAFAEMNGQATYDRGTVALRNVNIGAGALNAGASADISQGGSLSGRIVADMKTAAQIQRATLLIGGTVKEPQVRN